MSNNISTAHPSKWRLVIPFLSFLSDDEKGDDLILFCSEANIPGITLDVTPIETGFMDFKDPSNRITFDDLIITYAVDELYTNYKLLFNWLMYIKDPNRFEVRNQRVDASLYMYTNNDNPSFEFVFRDIFPSNIEPLSLDKKISDNDDFLHTVTFTIDSQIPAVYPVVPNA